MNINTIVEKALDAGLHVRGGFAVSIEDHVPPMHDGKSAASLLLLGNIGSSIWPAFSNSEEHHDGHEHPLDRWSQRIGNRLASELGAVAHYPFGGPPYSPFIQWAQKAERMQPSAIGLLMHPKFGLWHAYRLALAFPVPIVELEQSLQDHSLACDNCTNQPCMSACPVEAFTADGYDVVKCVQFLDQHPTAECHQRGCKARMICPEGEQYRYEQAHAAFHMNQFVAARLKVMRNECG